jgi:hypothetical protein
MASPNSAKSQGSESPEDHRVREQVSRLATTELSALRFLVEQSTVTDTQMADFCRTNGQPVITAAMLAKKVEFLDHNYETDPTTWSVKPHMMAGVVKALSKLA